MKLQDLELAKQRYEQLQTDDASWLEPDEREFLKIKWFNDYAKPLLDLASIHLNPASEMNRISEQVVNLQKQINELKSMMKNKADQLL